MPIAARGCTLTKCSPSDSFDRSGTSGSNTSISRGVLKYIETFYNPVRIHRSLGSKSLDKFEAENATDLAA